MIKCILTVLVLPIFLVNASFDPDVRWSCSDSAFSIFVRTASPFEGIISPRDSDVESCTTRGIGTNLAVLKLDFNRTDCGVQYDSVEDVYFVPIDVHSHPILIVDEDKSINITCRPKSNNFSSTSTTQKSSYTMELMEDGISTLTAHYAAPYLLRITNTKLDPFTVGICRAEAGQNTTVELTDSRGCSLLPSILSDFNRSELTMTSQFHSMFRLPVSSHITLLCTVFACGEKCEDQVCGPEESSPVYNLLDGSDSARETLEGQTVSMTFSVLDKKQKKLIETARVPPTEPPSLITSSSMVPPPSPEASVSLVEDTRECARPSDLDLMYNLCIFLTVCSTVGFSINILFCCILWRRRSAKRSDKARPQNTAANGQRDFWIMDSSKPTSEPNYFDNRRISAISYASIKRPARVPLPTMEYGLPPTSRSSESSSGYGAEIYRRSEVRPTSFMTPSTTMETDLDSSISSNQASSYH